MEKWCQEFSWTFFQLASSIMNPLSCFIAWCMAQLGKRQQIFDDHMVSRSVFDPPMGKDLANLVWREVFQFPSDNQQCESVIWRKFAPKITRVHRIECRRQRVLRAKGRKKTYTGALTACVGRIREFRNPNNHGFLVSHEPSEGIHHVHIQYQVSPNNPLTRSDKNELKFALKVIFDDRSPHTCPEGRG